MQECPTSPRLWPIAIFMEAPQQRKGRSVDALKKAGEHPAVIIAVARLFWGERKIEKTRQWMGNAITADQDWGDAWGWWLKFERQHGEVVSTRYTVLLIELMSVVCVGETGSCYCEL
jgi:pre-mRNA-processing factor 6